MTKKDEWYPKTKEEFEAYARAMDEANDMIANNANKKPAKKTPAKKAPAKSKKK